MSGLTPGGGGGVGEMGGGVEGGGGPKTWVELSGYRHFKYQS